MSARPGWLYPLVVLSLLSPARGAAAMPKECLDREGDALPAGAVDRLGTVRLRHGQWVHAVAFSPSGDLLATSGEYGSIALWRISDGKLLRKLEIEDDWEGGDYLAFSRDGEVLACARPDSGRISIWDAASGRLRREIDLHSLGGMTSFALAPDGKTIAAGFDNRVLGCWDVQTGKQIRHYPKTMQSFSLAYSADGKVLMSGDGDRNVRVWTAGELRRLGDHPDPAPKHDACVIALSPDGKTFAHAIGNHLQIRDAKTGARLHELPGHEGKIRALAFSADGKMLASFGGSYFTEAGRPSLRWWDARTGRLLHAVTDLAARSVAFSPDGKILAAGGYINTTQLWDTASGKALLPSQGHRSTPQTLAYSPDGRLLASAGVDGVILLWDLRAKSPPRRLRGCRGWVLSLVFSPDGRLLASAGKDGQIRLWSPASGRVVRQWTAHAEIVWTLLFAPDGRTLFSGDDADGSHGKAIRQWDVATGKEVRRLMGHKGSIHNLLWSIPGEMLISHGFDKTIRSWDVRSGREIHCWRKGLTLYWSSLAVSPDGCRLVAQCYGGDPMEVWDLTAKSAPSHFTGVSGIDRLLFSPDGRTLVRGDTHTGTLKLWETLTEKPRGKLSGHLAAISCLAFSPDGKQLATGSEDTSILVWDMRRAPSENVSAPLRHGELEQLWRDLGERDARLAYRAVLRLAAHPAETLALLRKHLTASASVDPRRLRRRIDALHDKRLAVRERARRELEEVIEHAEPYLRQALTEKPTLEMRLRIEQILASQPPLYDENAPADRLRELRAVEVLERIGNSEAQRFLAVLAAGAPSAGLTRAASAARKRLEAATLRDAGPTNNAVRLIPK